MLNSTPNHATTDRTVAVTQKDQNRRTDQRSRTDHILQLAVYLRADERFLIQQVFEYGLRLSDIARQSRRSRSSVQNRVNKILRRMVQPLFGYMITHGDLLSRPVRRTGEQVILRGRSLRDSAQTLGLTLHTVRQHMQVIRSLSRL